MNKQAKTKVQTTFLFIIIGILGIVIASAFYTASFDNNLNAAWEFNSVDNLSNPSIIYDYFGLYNSSVIANYTLQNNSGLNGSNCFIKNVSGSAQIKTFSSSDADALKGLQEGTWVAWINITYYKATRDITLIAMDGAGYGNDSFYGIYTNGLIYSEYQRDNETIIDIFGDVNFSNSVLWNTWHQIAYSWNASNGYLWFDGQLNASDNIGRTVGRPVNSNLYFGVGSVASNLENTYCLDNFRIYNVSLNSSQINDLYVNELVLDLEYPVFSGYSDNNGSFSNYANATFNITLLSTNGTVFLQINNTNYTANNLTANDYNISINNLISGVYSYQWISWGNGSSNNFNITSTRYYTVNDSFPLINILSPTNTTFIFYPSLNYTVSDSNLQSCWYTLDSGVTNISVVCGNNVSGLTPNQGSNIWKVYANDTSNNINTSSITFYVDTIIPTTTLINPINNSYNSTSSMNFTVNLTDNLEIKNSTLYINGVENTTVSYGNGITNTILGITLNLVDGVYTWFYKVFDYLSNSGTSQTNTLTIDTIKPLINLVYPTNITYTANVTSINYTVSDINLNSCWYTLNGGATNTTITCGNNVTSITSNEGNNNWKIYVNDSANNINSSSITFTVITDVPNITLISPANNFNTTSFGNINFRCDYNSTIQLKNSTFYLYNSTALINTTSYTITGTTNTTTTTVNLSYYDTYKWNCLAVNINNLSTFSITNNTVSVWQNILSIDDINIFPSTVGYLDNGRIQSTMSIGNNSGIVSCNFSVSNSDGLILNNINGTSFSNGIFNSSLFLMNKTGLYNFNVTCINNFGTSAFREKTYNLTYNLNYNPSNYTFAVTTAAQKTALQSFNISLFDDSNGSIYLNATPTIQSANNFTLSISKYSILLNSTDLNTNPVKVQLNLNTSTETANGTYMGNVTFTNSTYNLTYVVYFTFGINPPAGIISIYDSTGGTLCGSSSTDICANSVSLAQTASGNKSYLVNNTGFNELSNCTAFLSTDFVGQSWYSVDGSVFNLSVNTSKLITISYNPTVYTSVRQYNGNFYVKCNQSDIGNNPSTSAPSNQPYISLTIIGGGGGTIGGVGGGGGSGGTPITYPSVVGGNESGWKMMTEQRTGLYQFSMPPGSTREREIWFENIGAVAQNITISCEGGDICNYITFDKIKIDLPVGLEIVSTIKFKVNIPANVQENTYTANIIGKDGSGRTNLLTIQVKIGTSFLVLDNFTKLTKSKDTDTLGKIPYLLIFFGLIGGIIFFLWLVGVTKIPVIGGISIIAAIVAAFLLLTFI